MYNGKDKTTTPYRNNTPIQDLYHRDNIKAPQGLRVTVEDPPIPFSPFSLANCILLNHFSFNDFIAIAFLDIAGDLDIQI